MNRLITTFTLLAAPVLLAASLQLGEDHDQPRDWSHAGSLDGMALRWGDYDLDGLDDVFAIAGKRGVLLHNEGDGRFTDMTLPLCLAPEAVVLEAAWGDYDADGWVDLLTILEGGAVSLWRSDEGGCFVSATTEMGLAEVRGVQAASWLDFDRDGVLDLHLVRLQGHALLHGSSEGGFALAAAGPELNSPTATVGSARGQASAPAGPLGSGTSAATINLPGPSGSALAGAGTYTTPCSAAVLDQATQSCIGASSDPMIGLLYPLSSDFNVSSVGDIQFGDGTDRTTVIQNGATASMVTADGGGNMYIQTGTSLTPGSTARLLFTGMQGSPVHAAIDSDGDVGIGVNNPDAQLHVKGASSQSLIKADIGTGTVFEVTGTGRVVTTAVEITGGGDLVEGFETTDGEAEPGTVMIIDSQNVGQLVASAGAYDTKVAGVVSGAGGVNHGIRMGQDDVLDGDTLLAMTGRVYVKCSSENGSIRPGDRLTTASLAGHAMKVTDNGRSIGAVIGKAMSSLDEDTGLVLVLVNLQ